MAKLFAISDLHVGHRANRELLARLPAFPDDWLIVAGDVGETVEHVAFAWRLLGERFARLIWVPGNHELWTLPGEKLRGEDKYQELVALAREHGVLTPEDPYPAWQLNGETYILAPLFVLYDYSFRPDEVPEHEAVAWAMASGILAADEHLLAPDPYPSRQAWCHARVELSEQRLKAAAAKAPLVLINHFPLRYDLVRLFRIPRFSIWCGTRRTEDWHLRFRAKVVVSGHLHLRATDWRDGVRFEEVSLGNPGQWDGTLSPESHLREILPGQPTAPGWLQVAG